jgi:hypothetical protein
MVPPLHTNLQKIILSKIVGYTSSHPRWVLRLEHRLKYSEMLNCSFIKDLPRL